MVMASRFTRLVGILAAVALLHVASPAAAQSGDADEEVSISTVVAKALVDRGNKLFRGRDYVNARQLFIEALERDPKGPYAGSALAMLQRSNSKLGRYKDDGKPAVEIDTSGGGGGGGGGGGDTPIDPYGNGGDGGGGDTPIDPYANGGDGGGGDTPIDPYASGPGGGGDTPIDPYANGGGGTGPIDKGEPSRGTSQSSRRELMLWSGSYGFVAGLGVAGDSDSAALLGLLGGAGGVGITHWATRRYDLSQGEISAVESAGTWGALNLMFIGHLIDGTESEYTAAEGFRYAAVGGLVGLGAGILWAKKSEPDPGDIALANSFAAYGAAAGAFIGVALDPPEDEAYTLNAAIGSTIGFASGMFLAPKLDPSRRRTLKMDLGAALGAGAAWALLYPLVEDGTTTSDEQTVGVISTLTMGAGAYLAWRLTRGDKKSGAELEPAPVPAVARRNARGQWTLHAPLPRPMENPVLAPPTGAFTLGADLLGGRF
jgi:hypothetical protein